MDSSFTIELIRLLAQGAAKLKAKKPITSNSPLSPTQLLFLIWSITPPVRQDPLEFLQEDSTSAGVIATLLVGSLGFRFGEITPHDCLAINRSYTSFELTGIPRIEDIILYTKQGTVLLDQITSAQEQRRTLGKFIQLPSAKMAFRCKRTKMG